MWQYSGITFIYRQLKLNKCTGGYCVKYTELHCLFFHTAVKTRQNIGITVFIFSSSLTITEHYSNSILNFFSSH